jgi:C_GCAxxG_C_C family probable redox protein
LNTKPMSTTPLPPEQAKAEALARFADQGPDHINCAQAVLRFALVVMACDPALITTARYFGGGMAGMGEVCGAISGAALALGLRDCDCSASALGKRGASTDDAAATRTSLQASMREFAAQFGALRCRDLTGCDLTTPEGHDAFVKSGANERCQLFVGWMCDQLLPLLNQGAAQAARA